MKKRLLKGTEEGVTLLESLVGIAVTLTIVAVITPPLVMGYATRIKNYRTDQAIKLARGEIDRVRLEVEREIDITRLPPGLPQGGAGQFDLDRLVVAPSPVSGDLPSCPLSNVTGSTPVTTVCGADINGDGQWDLGMQTFRSSTPSPSYEQAGEKPVAFLMGVRVYTRAALTASPSSLRPLPRRDTGGLGLTSGSSISLPLVTFYTPIVKSDLRTSRYAYCQLNNEMVKMGMNGIPSDQKECL